MRAGRSYGCENLRLVAECLEFQCIPGGVVEEHGGLLTGLSFKADMRLDHEADTGPFQPLRQSMPLLP